MIALATTTASVHPARQVCDFFISWCKMFLGFKIILYKITILYLQYFNVEKNWFGLIVTFCSLIFFLDSHGFRIQQLSLNLQAYHRSMSEYVQGFCSSKTENLFNNELNNFVVMVILFVVRYFIKVKFLLKDFLQNSLIQRD